MNEPVNVDKPWGGFRQIVKNTPATVKILFVKSGEEFSLQKHHHRDEFWRVIVGSPDITIGKDVHHAQVGEEFYIPAESIHRIAAPEGDVQVLEVSTGNFDEDDIVRLEDKYGRI